VSVAVVETLRAILEFTVAGILGLFALYPPCLFLASRLRRPRVPCEPEDWPSVSLLVVVRNAESFIADKVRNALELDYPEDRLQLVFCSDGSTDDTDRVMRETGAERLTLLRMERHVGKIAALNRSIDLCRGEIVLLSDADAMLDRDAVRRLVRHFTDPGLGGVCGQRVIARDRADLSEAQSRYIGLDSAIKLWENRLGSITSNDGKIYAIRRELFHPIPPAVSDDLCVALDIVRQHRRFSFEPGAIARIRVPSRSPAHEIERRRRIVSQSCRSIYSNREVLNPLRHGAFAPALAVNKILRRLMPFALVGLLVASAWRAPGSWLALAALAAQLAFYGLALAHPLIDRLGLPPVRRLSATACYFALGQLGTLLGVVDFCTGRQVTKWDPVKTDESLCSRS